MCVPQAIMQKTLFSRRLSKFTSTYQLLLSKMSFVHLVLHFDVCFLQRI